MRILQVIPTYKPAYGYGGPIISIGLLCENLVSKGGCEVVVAATNANIKQDLPVHSREPVLVEGVKVYYFRRITPDHSQLSPSLLWYLWRNVRSFDAVHLHSWWNLSVMFATFVCILRGVRPVFSPRGMLSPFSIRGAWKPTYHRFIGKKLLAKTFLHATAEAERVECLNILPNWQNAVLPNFLDFSEITQQPQAKTVGKTFEILFLSRIHEKKGIDILLNALVGLPFDWRLTIAGSGEADYTAQLKQQAALLGISDKINWVGFVETTERFKVFAAADLFVLPSHNENFANVVLESLAVGTPVLVSQYVATKDYVLEKKLGWVCDTTAESVRQKLIEAHTQTQERQRINAESPRQIHVDFDPSVLARRYIHLYEKVSGRVFAPQNIGVVPSL